MSLLSCPPAKEFKTMTGLSHKDDYLETPPWLVTDLESWTGLKFMLDVSASENNKKCPFIIDEGRDALGMDWLVDGTFQSDIKIPQDSRVPIFNNPPRSKNKKFVLKAGEQWKKHNLDIVQLICWNDLGNKYCDEIRENILSGRIKIKNLGKIKFYKDGKETDFPSRLAYLAIWYPKQ